jgi:hypothetical protein
MTALEDIAAERKRQIEEEGWTSIHDDQHDAGEMARAAACFALAAWCAPEHAVNESVIIKLWPWEWRWYKPSGKRRDLVRAGALIIAEIERIDRTNSAASARIAHRLARS